MISFFLHGISDGQYRTVTITHPSIPLSNEEQVFFKMYNAIGSEVLAKKLDYSHLSKHQIIVADLPAGSYFYKLEGKARLQSGIWIKSN